MEVTIIKISDNLKLQDLKWLTTTKGDSCNVLINYSDNDKFLIDVLYDFQNTS
jgi:hypothetical protein